MPNRSISNAQRGQWAAERLTMDQVRPVWQLLISEAAADLVVGADIAAFGKGPAKSLAGVRLSYRSGLTVTELSYSLHWLLVTVGF